MELEPKFEPRVTPNEIGVAVKDGVVTLTGWVLRSAEVDAQRITVEMQGRPCLASSSFPWRSTPTGSRRRCSATTGCGGLTWACARGQDQSDSFSKDSKARRPVAARRRRFCRRLNR